MSNALIPALLSVTLVSLISLVGVVTVSISERLLAQTVFFLVALSAGALFGDAFIHLIPEALSNGADPIYILLGIVSFFVLEKLLHWQHTHQIHSCTGDDCEKKVVQPVGNLVLVSDSLHNLLDGIIIGAGFLAGNGVGLATVIAVVLHEIPQEMGDFGVLLHAGYTKGKAVLYNLLSGLTAILGTLMVLFIGSSVTAVIPILLAATAGGFIYIAGSDLVPELHKETKAGKSIIQLLAFLLGILLMLLLLTFE